MSRTKDAFERPEGATRQPVGLFDGCRIPDPLAPPEQVAAAIVPTTATPKRSGLEITPTEYAELAELLPLLDEPVGSERGVDARSLHGALKVGTRFNDWIGRRLEELGLVEGVDFGFYSQLSKTPGRPRTEYVVSVTGAKHLAMAEANERGRLVRAYFIAAEKKLREVASGPAVAKVAPTKADDRLAAKLRELELRAEKERRLLAKEILGLAQDYRRDGNRKAADILRADATEHLTGKSIPALLPPTTEPRFLSPEQVSEAVWADKTHASLVGQLANHLGLKTAEARAKGLSAIKPTKIEKPKKLPDGTEKIFTTWEDVDHYAEELVEAFREVRGEYDRSRERGARPLKYIEAAAIVRARRFGSEAA